MKWSRLNMSYVTLSDWTRQAKQQNQNTYHLTIDSFLRVIDAKTDPNRGSTTVSSVLDMQSQLPHPDDWIHVRLCTTQCQMVAQSQHSTAHSEVGVNNRSYKEQAVLTFITDEFQIIWQCILKWLYLPDIKQRHIPSLSTQLFIEHTWQLAGAFYSMGRIWIVLSHHHCPNHLQGKGNHGQIASNYRKLDTRPVLK